MNRWVGVCLAVYRRLANAFPHEFRMLYGEDLDRAGEDAVPEIWRHHGAWGLARLLVDIAIRLPAEYLSEMRQDVLYALRLHSQSSGFAAVSILSLAIGIGMCSVLLSQSKSLIGPAPGLPDADGLMTLNHGTSYPDFEQFRDRRQVAAMAAVLGNPIPFAVRRTDAAEGDRGAPSRPDRLQGANRARRDGTGERVP